MIVVAHRGLFGDSRPLNSLSALEAALREGFGIEFDVRTGMGVHGSAQVMVSHDIPPQWGCCSLIDVAQMAEGYPGRSLLVDVKEEGLASRIMRDMASMLVNGRKGDVFLFDLNGPEAMRCSRYGIPFLGRFSEYEPAPEFPGMSGLWVDGLDDDWPSASNSWETGWDEILSVVLSSTLERKTMIFFASPELHGRPYLSFWERIKRSNVFGFRDQIGICTDRPEEARRFFS